MRFVKRCSLELNEREVRRRTGWLPRNAKLIFVRFPTEHGWELRWFVVLGWDEGQFITVPVLSQSFLIDNDGINHTYTSDSTWTNANNSVEVIGGAGSGGVHAASGTATGGGGGAYNKITNFPFAIPGTTTAVYRVGLGGVSVTVANPNSSAGNPGGDTWWNSVAFPTTGTAVGAKGGAAGQVSNTGPLSGAAGGAAASGYPVGGFSGGRSGSTSGTLMASGAGAAAGPNGAGGNGGDLVASGSSRGGTGDAGFGGQGGGGGFTVGDGTEWGTAGSGGGGSSTRLSAHGVGGDGGFYGGGGGCVVGTSTNGGDSGNGILGIIALTWTPLLGPDLSTLGVQGISACDW